jgi:two-component system, LytTR family, response regulator
MIKTLIIDDEEHNRAVLRTLLAEHCPAIEIIDEAANAEEAYIKINKLKPQLLLLDIKMPKKSGFGLLKMFHKIDFEVIFVTAFDKYAIRAFEFNALGYILKPIDHAKLIKAVEKAAERISGNIDDNLVLHFVKTLSDTNELVHKISVHHNGKVVFINIDEVVTIEAREENSTLTLLDKTHYYSSKRLSEFETLLEESKSFIRINKNMMANTNYIKSYSKGEVCMIEMKTGQMLEVSRRRKAEILKKLKFV